MKLTDLTVYGYRALKGSNLQLESDITVVAGANNSGKTSLVELLQKVFSKGRGFSVYDINTTDIDQWIDECIERRLITEKSKTNPEKQELQSENLPPAPVIKIQITVGYDKENDDIRLFSEYLMDLDPSMTSIYFQVEYGVDDQEIHDLIQELRAADADTIEHHEFHEKEAKPLVGAAADAPSEDTSDIGIYRERLAQEIKDTWSEVDRINAYYCDSSFQTKNELPIDKLRALFNFRTVKADRELEDVESDRRRTLSRRLVEAATRDPRWEAATADLPTSILKAIRATDVKEIAEKAGLEALSDTVKEYSKTNGKSPVKIGITSSVTQYQVDRIMESSLRAEYKVGDTILGEKSQGLGYSNLIFLHLEIEAFINESKSEMGPYKVNILCVEEPESHMHPQMQNAFSRHLAARLEATKIPQLIVTTHSGTIVKNTKLVNLRIARNENLDVCFKNLKLFETHVVSKLTTDERRLFEILFRINFSDIIFADKAIIYEGDTERMFIEAIIEADTEWPTLKQEYISYVQVGGQHAHVYAELVDRVIGIKTLMLSDVDYKRSDRSPEVSSVNDSADAGEENTTELPVGLDNDKSLTPIQDREIGNSTLRALLDSERGGASKTSFKYSELVSRCNEGQSLAVVGAFDDLAIAFQSPRDHYARTLEEAMLCKFFKLDILDKDSRVTWAQRKKQSKLEFSIPQNLESLGVADIVRSTSSSKTRFMHSVLAQEDFSSLIPEYIRDGLNWLVEV